MAAISSIVSRIVAIGHTVHRQASIMGYADMFFLLGAALVLTLLATACLRKTGHPTSAAVHEVQRVGSHPTDLGGR